MADQRLRRLGPPIAAGIALAVLIAIASGIGHIDSGPLLAPTPRLEWTPADFAAALVRPGTRVEATGAILAYPGGTRIICRTGGAVVGGERGPHIPFVCSGGRASLEGLDLGRLPGRIDEDGYTWSSDPWLRVDGTWTGHAIRVTSVRESSPPESIGVVWEGMPECAPNAPCPSVDPAAMAELQQVRDAFAFLPDRRATIVVPLNRVRLEVIVLDQPMTDYLADFVYRHPEAFPDPLVVKG